MFIAPATSATPWRFWPEISLPVVTDSSQDNAGGLKAVYFIHIPPPGKQGDPATAADYDPLAGAMATLIHMLVLHTVLGSAQAVRQLGVYPEFATQ